MSAPQQLAVAATAELRPGVEQFYAQQMFLLDSGQAEAWAETFTPEGVFAANAHPEPFVGRAAIASGARQAADAYAAQGVQRRHWLGMVAVERRDEDRVLARSYALVIETPRGGSPAIRASTLCEDILVREGEGWLVADRRVTRDDLF
ncbi:nuclear transport factor 2 family protein [Streptomyces sp. NPDC048417]|uniref:nuclear transport factor 2 family protein n=1 Tax=Streptomyces sp. NPDC048417 TaxID=3155387 RepID=UPI0034247AF3